MNIGFISKLIAKENFKKFGKNALKVVDGALLGGVINNNADNLEEYPKGKVDPYKLIGALVPLTILVAFLCKMITIEQVEQLLEIF